MLYSVHTNCNVYIIFSGTILSNDIIEWFEISWVKMRLWYNLYLYFRKQWENSIICSQIDQNSSQDIITFIIMRDLLHLKWFFYL
jgi:hypothetical protein